MAIDTLCAQFLEDQLWECGKSLTKSFYQQLVVLPMSFVESKTFDELKTETEKNHALKELILKTDRKGALLMAPSNGSTIKGWFEKTTTDNGITEYKHMVQALFTGSDQEALSNLSALDGSRFMVFLHKKSEGNDQIMLFGGYNGLKTEDYTFDIVENSGVVPITFASPEKELETVPPHIVLLPDTSGAITAFNNKFGA